MGTLAGLALVNYNSAIGDLATIGGDPLPDIMDASMIISLPPFETFWDVLQPNTAQSVWDGAGLPGTMETTWED